jgi:hypothetical protein
LDFHDDVDDDDDDVVVVVVDVDVDVVCCYISTCKEELLFVQHLPYTRPLKHQELHWLPICLKFPFIEK